MPSPSSQQPIIEDSCSKIDKSESCRGGTVETHIKEPRFLLSSLDRFLISRLIFLLAVCKVINKGPYGVVLN